MASITTILDHYRRNDGRRSVCLLIHANETNTKVTTGVYIEPGNFIGGIRPIGTAEPGYKWLNDKIEDIYREHDQAVYELEKSGKIRLINAAYVKQYLDLKKKYSSSMTFWQVRDIVVQDAATDKTREMFRYMSHVIDLYTGNERNLLLEDMDKQWFIDFIAWMDTHSEIKGRTGIGKSTQAIILRHMKVVYNKAIRLGVVQPGLYPFPEFKMPKKRKAKEYLDIDAIRRLRDVELEPGGAKDRARDFFLLSFYLCGINPIDLWNMRQASGGYIQFVRQKTQNKSPEEVRFKVQPEAQAIIDKWAGHSHLLCFSETFRSYDSFYATIRHRLDSIARDLNVPSFHLYLARYSWATYACHEDVPEYVIDKSLTHAENSVAAKHYISYDWRKTDKANRRVIDFVASSRGWEEDDVAW